MQDRSDSIESITIRTVKSIQVIDNLFLPWLLAFLASFESKLNEHLETGG
jgi:hypothetical protein